MSTYKRLCLLLCSLFMFCVGFLSASNTVYAYSAENNFYPIIYENAEFVFRDINGAIYNEVATKLVDGKYYYDNPVLNGVVQAEWYKQYTDNQQFTFPFQPDLYDYYLLGTLTGECKDDVTSTFKPTRIGVGYRDVDTNSNRKYDISNLLIYDIDNSFDKGFGFSMKVDFESVNNIGISYIAFYDDANGSGSKPANLVFEAGILAFEKGTDESEVNHQILSKLNQMSKDIDSGFDQVQDSVKNAADQVTDVIENQYGMTPDESFGVQDLTSQVEEKLGVLSFGSDTLSNFLGLFQASNVGSTVLTFPGFTINVQGESYKVWNDIQFDLAFLEENFGFLIDTVRTVTVLCVWLAVLGYLVKAYEHLVNNKG